MGADATVAAGFARAMEATGFYRNGKPGTGVSTRQDLSDPRSEKHFKYKAVVEKLGAAAVFELSGSPCIYFSCLEDASLSDEKLTEMRQLAWNHGLAPTLWVVSPTAVRIYNCYSRPETPDPGEHKQHLIRVFYDIEHNLAALNEFAGKLQYETGQFWRREEARKIDRRQRVDASLLKDLGDAQQDLVRAGLPRPVAHALLGWSIFVAYLQDRRILKPEFFRANYEEEKFTEVLRSKPKTERLWGWVRRTFNGDLFPLAPAERRLVEPEHLSIVRRVLEGTSSAGQMRLWPYRFDVIPVELISSIYEMFTHSADPEKAKGLSAHYTPLNLVDLVLSQVFEGMPATGKVGDLSCGSGVFLVEALRRLVSRRLAADETLSRRLIREVLHRQIFGVDILPGAVRIAAFSLYLTVLELDPNPQPPSALRFKRLIGRNLFVADAFDDQAEFAKQDVFANKGFSAIVGNPPWTRTPRNSSNAAYCKKHNHPTAQKGTPDQAFLWRIGDFASTATRIGLILHGKPFFSHVQDARRAREALLQRFTPRLLLNLAELHQLGLFPTAMAPAMVFIADGGPPPADASFTFGAARRSEGFRNHGIVEIPPDCINRLPLTRAARDPDMLKVASWGGARDMALVQRLRDAFPPLSDFAGERPHGQGFKRSGERHKAPQLQGKPLLEAGEMPPFIIRPKELPVVGDVEFHRPRDPRIYEGPLVIATRGIRRAGFYAAVSPSDVVYDSLYYGFSLPERDARLLNGILNSRLATYWLFMTASTWGVERDELQPVDLLRLPVPPAFGGNAALAALVVEAVGACEGARADGLGRLRRDLDEAVYRLYGVGDDERALVEDTVETTIRQRRKREASRALARPRAGDLVAYLRQVDGALTPLLQARGMRRIHGEVLELGTCPLSVVRLAMVPARGREPVAVMPVTGLESVLSQIGRLLHVDVTDEVFTKRFLRIYAPDELYIIKPAELRYWTRSAALRDADEILAEHMGGP